MQRRNKAKEAGLERSLLNTIKRILITPGEPAGIGPDVTIKIAQLPFEAELIVIADSDLLLRRALQLNLPLTLITADLNQPPEKHRPSTLKILPVTLKEKVTAGKINIHHAPYVISTLEMAAALCLAKRADAIVTGPVNKEALNEAGIYFMGHTEFFASKAKVSQTVMLFVVDQLKVALATTHLPLAKVPSAITKEYLKEIIRILDTDLKKYFHLTHPRILICGLNPHAGENGYLGHEEIEIINPLIAELNTEHYSLLGSLSADTIFTPKNLQKADAVLAMYHDQALPLIKYIGFNHAVNMTLGLPFVRTSVDHGTALELAGTALADAGSLQAAISLAIQLS